MNLKTDNKGFTLIELLIVIVVIAILAAISVVAYTGFQNRAKDSAALELASQVEAKARAFQAIKGELPSGITDNEFTDVNADPEAPEAQLEGANVVQATSAPTNSDFTNGKQVGYNPNGTIYYRKGSGHETINLN